MKVEKLHDDIEITTRKLDEDAPKRALRVFSFAKITSHEGTEYMNRMGLKSVLALLDDVSRQDLAGNVVAGFVRWRPVNRNGIVKENSDFETHSCLMCFKTRRALEIMLCDDRNYIPEKLSELEIAPVLELRKHINFTPRVCLNLEQIFLQLSEHCFVLQSNLRVQLRYDRSIDRYLQSQRIASNFRRLIRTQNDDTSTSMKSDTTVQKEKTLCSLNHADLKCQLCTIM